MTYAPIALFTYNRADHTQKAVESLLLNAESKESDLFIFSDGPKNEKAVDGVKKNREYIHEIKKLEGIAFKSVTLIEREKNWGLANSLIAGITDVINQYGKIIVVEDDLILSPFFLKFMNEGLEKYNDEDRVGAISAYIYSDLNNIPNTFFLRHFHCWGWATWSRAWNLLNTDTRSLLRQMRWKKKEFDVGGYAGAYGNLYCQHKGLIDSWWVRYYASLFLANKLVLYPGISLVQNNGCDGSGTHSANNNGTIVQMSLAENPIVIQNIPIVENKNCYNAFCKHFEKNVSHNSLRQNYEDCKSFIRRMFYIDCL